MNDKDTINNTILNSALAEYKTEYRNAVRTWSSLKSNNHDVNYREIQMKSKPLIQPEIDEISVRFENNRPTHPKRKLEKEMIKTQDLMPKLALMALLILGTQSAHAAPELIPLFRYEATVKATSSGFTTPDIPLPKPKEEPVFGYTLDLCNDARYAKINELNALPTFTVYDEGVCESVIIGWIEIPVTKPPRIDLSWPFLIDDIHVKRLMNKYNIRDYNEALQELNYEFDIEGFKSELQREIKATGR